VTSCPIRNANKKISTETAGVEFTVIVIYGSTVRITMTGQYVLWQYDCEKTITIHFPFYQFCCTAAIKANGNAS
jgi:hypothetical protein